MALAIQGEESIHLHHRILRMDVRLGIGGDIFAKKGFLKEENRFKEGGFADVIARKDGCGLVEETPSFPEIVSLQAVAFLGPEGKLLRSEECLEIRKADVLDHEPMIT